MVTWAWESIWDVGIPGGMRVSTFADKKRLAHFVTLQNAAKMIIQNLPILFIKHVLWVGTPLCKDASTHTHHTHASQPD
eukprot:scaffold130926_cov26-Tisochrysis_lutea.AAC.1